MVGAFVGFLFLGGIGFFSYLIYSFKNVDSYYYMTTDGECYKKPAYRLNKIYVTKSSSPYEDIFSRYYDVSSNYVFYNRDEEHLLMKY